MGEPLTLEDVRELVGLFAAHYQTPQFPEDGLMRKRRDAQTIVVAEVLRLLDGDRRALDDLRERGYVPLGLDDLPRHLGGTTPDLSLDTSDQKDDG